MNIKARTLTLLASASLAVLLTALFVPVFCGFVLWDLLTLSVWDWSPPITLLGAAVLSVLILVPLIRPSAKAWLFPFLLGFVLLVAVLCATVHSFPVANDLSNVLFHLYGLILFAVGGLLCIIEGFHARSLSHLTCAAKQGAAANGGGASVLFGSLFLPPSLSLDR